MIMQELSWQLLALIGSTIALILNTEYVTSLLPTEYVTSLLPIEYVISLWFLCVLTLSFVYILLQIKNTSSLSVDYSIKFDSLSPLRYKMMQELPDFVSSYTTPAHVIGVQNYNGKCVFDCVPFAGTIPGGWYLSKSWYIFKELYLFLSSSIL